jgi:hypothetical protein
MSTEKIGNRFIKTEYESNQLGFGTKWDFSLKLLYRVDSYNKPGAQALFVMTQGIA